MKTDAEIAEELRALTERVRGMAAGLRGKPFCPPLEAVPAPMPRPPADAPLPPPSHHDREPGDDNE